MERVETLPVRRAGGARRRARAAARRGAGAGRAAGTRSWPTSTGSSSRPPPTGSTRASTPTSPPTRSGPSILGELRQRRPRHAGDALVDGPGLHRARDARARLAGRRCSTCRRRSGRTRHRRRRDPGTRRRATLVRCGRAHASRRRRAGAGGDPASLVRATARPQTHSSVEKELRVAGHRRDLRVDRRSTTRYAMRPDGSRGRSRTTAPPGCRRSSCCATLGTTSSLAFDPVAGDRRDLPRRRASGSMSTRRWRASAAICPEHRWLQRRPRARRQLLPRTRTSGCYTNFDCDAVLGARPRGADRGAVDPARVPAQRGDRERRGDRLPRLARAARPPVPGAQAVVRAAPLRRRGAAQRTARRTSRWRRSWPAQVAAASAARAGRAGAALAGLLPAPGRRRRDARAARQGERRRRGLPDAHRCSTAATPYGSRSARCQPSPGTSSGCGR